MRRTATVVVVGLLLGGCSSQTTEPAASHAPSLEPVPAATGNEYTDLEGNEQSLAVLCSSLSLAIASGTPGSGVEWTSGWAIDPDTVAQAQEDLDTWCPEWALTTD